MADVTITGLPNAATLTGTERVPMDQAGTTVDASAQAIANLATAATVGLGNVNNTSDLSKPISTATQTALDLKAAASAVSNVNNTSDLAKPISTATQAALDLKAATSHTQAASTITDLATVATSGSAGDLSSGTLPAARLPTSGVTSGSYGSSTLVPVITVDGTGRITAASTAAVSGGGGGVSSVTGTAPIVSSGGATPAISISAATTSTPGSMSAADKTKLDAAAASGAIGSSGLTMATARILGRSTASTGALEEIQIGSNLTLDAGILSATVTGGGGGTVTSVGLSLPALFSVSGSPVTTAGTLTAALATQSANLVLAGPTTGSSAPTFRALVAADLPATTVSAGSYTYSSFTVDAAGRITSASSGAAPLSVGTTSGTVAAGDDSRITGALSTATAASTYQPLTANLTSLGANAPSHYLDRTNHTGTQAFSTLTAVPCEIGVACSDETTALTTGTAKVTFRMPYAMTLTAVRVSVKTAVTVAALEVNLKEGGTTVFSTTPKIAVNEKTSLAALSTPGVINDSGLASDAEMTIDIVQPGGAATGLKVWLIGTRA